MLYSGFKSSLNAHDMEDKIPVFESMIERDEKRMLFEIVSDYAHNCGVFYGMNQNGRSELTSQEILNDIEESLERKEYVISDMPTEGLNEIMKSESEDKKLLFLFTDYCYYSGINSTYMNSMS